ncbi:flagellar basal-body rod protein FlgF [Cellulosilyticum sp. I15G10I2]|uniref:flagellar basal-body rod protein FlgF n=1 Tax=Cellulosilyticum sp. I15G10I2 TaxID=1892843 RepID=UPI00085BB8D1|nr:flagellar basal-body rod protein FlgF [Cellulosilyticum sp. I15G10I2]
MIRGLYTAATGMNVQTKKMDIISNDLANVNTTGYKKDTTIIASFPQVLASRIDDMQNHIPNNGTIGNMSLGAKVDEVYTNFIQGSVIKTDGMVDVAIQGEGFFAVQTPGGVLYTRDGNFSINQEGQVVTKEGYYLLSQGGTPLELGQDFLLNGGTVTIKESGELYRGSELVDTIALVRFDDPKTLTKVNDNLYEAGAPGVPFQGSIIQGFLEASNVNPVIAMVDMITVSRAYEANQKVIQTHDALLNKTVNEVGRA